MLVLRTVCMTGCRVAGWQSWWWLGADTEKSQYSLPNNTENYAASNEK